MTCEAYPIPVKENKGGEGPTPNTSGLTQNKDIDPAMLRGVQHQPRGSLENRARHISGKEKGFRDCACRQETLLVSLDRSMVKQR